MLNGTAVGEVWSSMTMSAFFPGVSVPQTSSSPMVSGVVKKWGTSLVGLDVTEARALVEDSRDYLAGQVGYEIDLFTDYPTFDLGPPILRP